MTLDYRFRLLRYDKRALKSLTIVFFAAAQLACAPQPEPESQKRATIYSGPNRYHDLTDLNYVTVWVRGWLKSLELTCVLNDRAQPCATFIRRNYNSNYRKETELYLPALPFGKNRLEIRRSDGAPLAVTEFEVCRRTLEIDFGAGPDGTLETLDDPVERVRTRAWKDNLANWESVNDGTDATARETLLHDWAFRTTETVEKRNNAGQLVEKEIRLFAFHGIPISSETFTPAGELSQYREFCTWTELPLINQADEAYTDGACPGFAPSFMHAYNHPGSDQTWRTDDDLLLEITEYYHKNETSLFRGALRDGRWFLTRHLTPPTDATLQEISQWFPQAVSTGEFHEYDPARPGLWGRTLLSRREPHSDAEQIGYRKYEYQCAP